MERSSKACKEWCFYDTISSRNRNDRLNELKLLEYLSQDFILEDIFSRIFVWIYALIKRTTLIGQILLVSRLNMK